MRYFLLTIVFMCVLGTTHARAGAVLPGTGCDQDYWNNVMGARSWMAGKHDMEAAQVLIERPKSIMEVMCFDGELIRLANAVDNIFSDAKPNPTTQVTALFKHQAFNPQDTYQVRVRNNHTYTDIGGSYGSIGFNTISRQMHDNTLLRLVRNALRTHFNNFYASPVSTPTRTATSVCGLMIGIWNTARCDNMNSSQFWTFAQLRAADPRVLPTACNLQRPKWASMMTQAFPPPTLPAASGGMDDTDTFLNLLNPSSCTTHPTNSLPPIPTGVVVDLLGVSAAGTHPDAVCSAPGCWYDSAANLCRP